MIPGDGTMGPCFEGLSAYSDGNFAEFFVVIAILMFDGYDMPTPCLNATIWRLVPVALAKKGISHLPKQERAASGGRR